MKPVQRHGVRSGATDVASKLNVAIAYHQSGQSLQAQALYQQILQTDPKQPDALHLLGLVEHQLGHSDRAIALIQQAIRVRPADASFHFNLGNLYQDLGQLDEAIACLEHALINRPDFIEAMLGLGTALKAQDRLEEAIAHYRQVIALNPDYADAHYNLGNALQQMGALPQAVTSYRLALVLKPSLAQVHQHLHDFLATQRQLDVTIERLQQLLADQPSSSSVLRELGAALRAQGRLVEALGCYRQVIAIEPESGDDYFNLASVLQVLGRLEEAACSYGNALLCKPARMTEVYGGLGNVLEAQGNLDEAIACYRQALALQPNDAAAHGSLLFTLQYSPTCSPEERFCEHQRFAERFETPLKSSWKPHPNNRDPNRRLKVGYVSGDFRNHPVAFFIEPILSSHDKSQVEVYGYYNHSQQVSDTLRIRACTDHWLVCCQLTDDQLAERIRADGIDILVDLSGHTELNRLLVFARKPAPIQVTWIGYTGSTGLTAMDYRITDPWMDPLGQTECYHTEALARLPSGGLAFRQEPACLAVNTLPALTSSELIFASLNTLNKINPIVVHLWGRILRALPQARLMLGNVTESRIQSQLVAAFGKEGVGSERLILLPRLTGTDYFAVHQKIDIGLDPFPYTGGTTTMHSLWMGVPVITLAGRHPMSRFGASLMSRVGLPEFICQNEDQYLACALKLAQNLPDLNRVRQSLRQRMSGANWEPANITHHLETAYRNMWQKWCTK